MILQDGKRSKMGIYRVRESGKTSERNGNRSQSFPPDGVRVLRSWIRMSQKCELGERRSWTRLGQSGYKLLAELVLT